MRIFGLNTSKQEQSGLILELVSPHIDLIRNQFMHRSNLRLPTPPCNAVTENLHNQDTVHFEDMHTSVNRTSTERFMEDRAAQGEIVKEHIWNKKYCSCSTSVPSRI